MWWENVPVNFSSTQIFYLLKENFFIFLTGFPKVVNDGRLYGTFDESSVLTIYHVVVILRRKKKVPSPSATAPLACSLRRTSSRGMESMIPPRQGSFRQSRSPVQQAPLDRPPLAFCKRRLSWPEINASSTSGWVIFSRAIAHWAPNSETSVLLSTLMKLLRRQI